MGASVRRADLVHSELSYKIVGCAYEVFNELGFGHAEKYYQKALSSEFKRKNFNFEEQVYTPLKYKDEVIGKLFFDFLIEEKVIVEIKRNGFFSKKNIDQVNGYLIAGKLKLALLINFTEAGVVVKRLVNILE